MQVVLISILLGLFTLGARALHHIAHLFLPGFTQILLLLLGFEIGAHCDAPVFNILALFHFARPERLNVLFLVVEWLTHVAVHFQRPRTLISGIVSSKEVTEGILLMLRRTLISGVVSSKEVTEGILLMFRRTLISRIVNSRAAPGKISRDRTNYLPLNYCG